MSLLRRRLAAPMLVAAACVAAQPAAAEQVTVFAAASLKTALDNFAEGWEAGTEDTVTVSYAGSPQLAQQIRQGAPADIFISAAPEWMDTLQAEALIDPATRVDLLGNSLVLIASGQDAPPVGIGTDFGLADMLGDGRLAMALVDSVPAGVYGKQALTALGVWEAVAPKVAQADNVRAALALVASGEAPMGIVYATDANAEDDVTVVGTFPADSHAPITYPAAIIAASADKQAARDFFEALRGDDAVAAFAAEGFTVLPK